MWGAKMTSKADLIMTAEEIAAEIKKAIDDINEKVSEEAGKGPLIGLTIEIVVSSQRLNP